jgi:hypothetical protein
MDFYKTFLVFCLAVSIPFVGRAGVANPATYDADEYLYYGTYNSQRNPLYVGVNDLTAGSPYQYHFNFAAVQFDLAGLSAGGTSYLQLSLMRFRVPGSVVPNGPPSYTYATSGYSFDLKVVALGDDFLEAENLSGSALQEWYANNLWNRPTVGIMNFNSAGAVSLDVSSAVDAWLANPASNFGFGLVGVTSGTQGLTAQFYSTENAVSSSNAPALIQAATQNSVLIDSWMTAKGFSGDSSLAEDPDHDGLSNLMEFLLGRDPLVPDSTGAITSSVQNNQLVIQFSRRAEENLGISWEVRTSDSLSQPVDSWPPVQTTERVMVNGLIPCTARISISADKPKQFLRVVVRKSS